MTITGALIRKIEPQAKWGAREAQRGLTARLYAAYPDELDEVVAAAVVGAFTSGLRAAAARSGPQPSGAEAQQAVDRVLRLLEHGPGR